MGGGQKGRVGLASLQKVPWLTFEPIPEAGSVVVPSTEYS